MKKNRTIAWNAALSAGENARLALPRMAREFFVLGRTAAKVGSTLVPRSGDNREASIPIKSGIGGSIGPNCAT